MQPRHNSEDGHTVTGSPRIVILDDEVDARNCHKVLIRWWFPEAVILDFPDGDAAWAEISARDPDLLITDYTHPGLKCDDMLQRLAARTTSYPIVISSAYVGFCTQVEQNIREGAAKGLQILFLHKPFDLELYRRMLEGVFGIEPPEHPQSFGKGE